MNAFTWIQQNGTSVLAIIAAVQAALVLIVKLTPTPKDDAFLAKVLPLVQWLGSHLSVTPKSTPKE